MGKLSTCVGYYDNVVQAGFPWWIILVLLLIIIVVIGACWFWQKKKDQNENDPDVEPVTLKNQVQFPMVNLKQPKRNNRIYWKISSKRAASECRTFSLKEKLLTKKTIKSTWTIKLFYNRVRQTKLHKHTDTSTLTTVSLTLIL